MMKNFTILLFSLFTAFASFAQDPDIYDLQVLNETYQDLDNPINLNGEDTWDDPFYFIPIGFPFEYQGNSYNYAVNFFGAGVLGFTNDTTFSSEPESIPIVLAFGADLVDAAYEDYYDNEISESPLNYKHSGTAGNGIFTYEVKNAAFYDQLFQEPDPSNTSRVSFQIVLKEADNSIEYHYGPSNIEDNSFLGSNSSLLAGIIADYDLYSYDEFTNFQFLLNDPSNPDFPFYSTSEEAMAAGVNSFLNSQPTEGTVYRLTNPNQVVGYNNLVAENLHVYPTATDDILTIENPIIGTTVSAQIIDIKGKIWQTEIITATEQIDISRLAKGNYFIKVFADDQLFIQQIQKL